MKTRELLLIFFFADLVILIGSVFIFLGMHLNWNFSDLHSYGSFTLLLVGGWLLTFLIFIDNMQDVKSNLWEMLVGLARKLIVFIAIVSVFGILFKINLSSPIDFFGPQALFFIFKIALSIYLLYHFSLKNKQNWSPTIIVGDNDTGNKLYRYFRKNSHLGLNPLGLLDNNFNDGSNPHVLGRITDFHSIYDDYQFNNLIIALPLSEKEQITDLIHTAERFGVRPRIVPHYYGAINQVFNMQMLGSIPLLNIRSIPLDRYPNRFWKRAFDLLFSSILLVLLFPVFVIIALAIKIDSKGPVLYKPVRIGIDNEPFVLYKFRSMKQSDSTSKGTMSTVLNDPRVTKLGRILRKYNLDELPQLINVLNNEMSLVGPRPHRILLNKSLQQKMNIYMLRSFVKPGITGWAQVNGWRGPTETKMQYMGRTLHDLWYIENWNFGLDLYILFLTIFGKKTGKNAF